MFLEIFFSSSGASKLYYSFWYHTRMSLPAGILGLLEFQHSPITSRQRPTCVIPEAVIQLKAPDDERKYRSKHVEQSRNNKLSYTVASCGPFCLLYHDTWRHDYHLSFVLEFPEFGESK